MNKEIDETDKKIVNILLFDADATNREIAAKCKIALGTVNNRIKRLKSLGVIKKKTIMVDYEKLGYQIEVLIALKIRKGSFYEVATFFDKVGKLPRIVNIAEVTIGGAKEEGGKLVLTTSCLATTYRFIEVESGKK